MNLSKISRKLSYIAFWIYGVSHPVKKKVVFNSFFGKQYSGNPRAICEKMHELYPEYELVWLLSNKEINSIPNYVRVVGRKDGFFAWGKEIATAASYVYNIEMQIKIFRKKNQSFIQTWHGDRAIKKILKDKNPVLVLHDDEVTTLCVSGSEFGSQLFRSAFGYNGDILCSGSPRNDCLFDMSEEKSIIIKKRIGIPADSKVVLYAPTFRDNKRKVLQESNIDIISMLDAFPKNEKWICLVRAHVASIGLSGNFKDARIIDVTKYPDMADILCITDFLVTDYSSCATDFSLTKKPIILALFDKQEYQKDCREFYVEPEVPGFIVAYDQKELEQKIQITTERQFREAAAKVNGYYGTKETGHAAEDVCHYINDYFKKNR